MTLIEFIVAVVLLGVIFWLVDRFLPMSVAFKAVIRVISILILIFLLLALFGVMAVPFRLR